MGRCCAARSPSHPTAPSARRSCPTSAPPSSSPRTSPISRAGATATPPTGSRRGGSACSTWRMSRTYATVTRGRTSRRSSTPSTTPSSPTPSRAPPRAPPASRSTTWPSLRRRWRRASPAACSCASRAKASCRPSSLSASRAPKTAASATCSTAPSAPPTTPPPAKTTRARPSHNPLRRPPRAVAACAAARARRSVQAWVLARPLAARPSARAHCRLRMARSGTW
mmetsp:Transcript_41348/g.109690  ORF Transcript_41348/g.109690 Transcript_41348/m.109690 type:complete len:225 (-) Transcript_41348:199-873(-)